MYRYRGLTPEEKTETLQQRHLHGFPPHLHDIEGWFLITAATYEHRQYFQTNEERTWILGELQKELQIPNIPISGWVVLPNHYHQNLQIWKLQSLDWRGKSAFIYRK